MFSQRSPQSALAAQVSTFKSESSHQADATFYVIARGFTRAAYLAAELESRLQKAIVAVIFCARAKELPGCRKVFSAICAAPPRACHPALILPVLRPQASALAHCMTVRAA